MSQRITLGPFNRVEGDLEVHLDIENDRVVSAQVNSPLYRGFEQILLGKSPLDALVMVPRICGICSVSQSVASAGAIAALSGVKPPRNGELCCNLTLAAENLADHLSHFYLFFMPDFAREHYRFLSGHDVIAQRFMAVKGSAVNDVLPARAEFLHLMGYLAGKWPHTLSVQPGGSTRPLQAQEILRMQLILANFRRFLERTLLGCPLEVFSALDSEQALESYWKSDEQLHDRADFKHFLWLSEQLDLSGKGRAYDRLLSFGAYALDNQNEFTRGIWLPGSGYQKLEISAIQEEISHSWLTGDISRSPTKGQTQPVAEKEGAYSWCKAPRLAGMAMETGAFARQVIDGHPLAESLMNNSGNNVRNRVVGRMLELARVVPLMQSWLQQIDTQAPFHHSVELPDGDGIGLTEAARGSLGHWISVRKGKLTNYQIIAPTTWNFSPRDSQLQPGPLEKALQGIRLNNDPQQIMIQHIVRSFDPCMVCTVH